MIVDKVQKISKQQTAIFRKEVNFLKLEEFYKAAIKSGIAKKPEYTLPQVDTIGVFFNISKPSQE